MHRNKNLIGREKRAANLAVLPMYLFSLVFLLGPLVYMILLSFETRDGFGAVNTFTLDNYKKFFEPVYFQTILESCRLALLSTVFVILLGYPGGLCMAFLPKKYTAFFRTAQMLPFFVNSLLRLVGWIILFRSGGLLDTVLMALGVTREPLHILYTYPAVVVGMVYVLLPFMLLSVCQVAETLNPVYIEAARDLGASPYRVFWDIILPLTLPGLKTGIVLTFIPSMGLFFIASILGGNKIVLMGSLIEEQLTKAHNTPFAAALSVLLMLFTGVVCLFLMRNPNTQKETRRKPR